MSDTKEKTWREKLAEIEPQSLAAIHSWLCHLSHENRVRTQTAAMSALPEPGSKQYNIALVLLGAQQSLDALVTELGTVITGE